MQHHLYPKENLIKIRTERGKTEYLMEELFIQKAAAFRRDG